MDYKKIKSYKDACRALGLKPISDEVFNAFGQDAKTVAAYHKLAVITRAINEGWQPDWSNRNEPKFEPYMYTNSAGLACANASNAPSDAYAYIGSRLCFHDYERAAFAVKTFGDTLYKDYFRPENYGTQKQDTAEESSQHTESENGGEVREEDDMTDAPDFLKAVMEAVKQHIEPLCEGNDNRAIIVIASENNAADKQGNTGFASIHAVQGTEKVLGRSLYDFMTNERTQGIVKAAYLRKKFEDIIEKGGALIKDFLDNICK